MLRSERQLDLWKQWRRHPTDENLQKLLDSFNPMIQKSINKFHGAAVPRDLLEIEAKRLAINAFKTYNPRRGTTLGTHVYYHLMGLSRYVGTHQNILHIPEHRRRRIQLYRNAYTELQETLGREPNIQELSERLKWPIREVERMESELRGIDVPHTLDPEMVGESGGKSRAEELLQLIYWDLTPEERLVYEYTLGVGGRPQLSTQEIAAKLKKSPSAVSRIKKSIALKIQKYLQYRGH